MPGRHFAARSRTSLAARGQFLPAFGGQAVWVALTLLALGAYLIEDQFANPVQAPAVGLLFAALLIATAVTLLYCLLEAMTRTHRRAWIHSRTAESWHQGASVVQDRGALIWRKDLPTQHRYVDRARVRL